MFYYYFYDWELRLTDRTCYSDLTKTLIEFGSSSDDSLEIYGLPPIIENISTYQLTGLPEGGEFTGNGVEQNSFDPNGISTGLNNIYYTQGGGTACENSVDTTILIYQKNSRFPENQINTVKP